MPYLDELYAGRAPAQDPDIPQPTPSAWGSDAPRYAPDIPRPSGYQPANADVTGTGRVQYEPSMRERALEWISRNMLSGGAGDVRNVAMALGPAAQASGAMGQIANWAARAGVPAKAPAALDAADQMFDPRMVAPVMRSQAGRVDPGLLAGGAAGGAAVLGAGSWLYNKLFGDETPKEPPPNAGVGVSAPAAARAIKSRADRIEASTDATLMPPAAFKAKWGGLPEEVLK